MKTLTAAQLIYTRVEAAYSPQRRDGFQTVYRSTTLSPSDISVIEQRIQCFQPPTSAVVRRQYFTLGTGSVVATQTQQIATHPDIVDKTRRAGAFLVHALVVPSEAFAAVDYNPFVLFDCGSWVQSAEEMVARFGQATGVAPSAALSVDGPASAPACAWSGVEVYKMVMLALQAEEWVRAQQAVPFIGSATDIDEALRTVLYLVPRHQRLACTFDTCIDGCPTPRGLYWAVGAATRPPGDTSALVATSKRQVCSQREPIGVELDLYLSWLHHVSTQDTFPEALQHVVAIQYLVDAFTKRHQPPLDADHTEAYVTFSSLHDSYLTQRIEDALTPTLGERLATLLGSYMSRCVDVPTLLRFAATQRLPVASVSTLAMNWLIDHKPHMRRADWHALQYLARRSRHPRLLHLAATIGEKVDIEARDEALSAMDAATFESVLEQCPRLLAPADLVTPAHVLALLASPRLRVMSAAQCLDLIAALLQVNAARYLSALIPHVPRLDYKQLAALEKMLTKHPAIPSDFRTAVYRRREALGPAPGWFRLFRK